MEQAWHQSWTQALDVTKPAKHGKQVTGSNTADMELSTEKRAINLWFKGDDEVQSIIH